MPPAPTFALGLIITALAKSISAWLLLTYAVALVRLLLFGQVPSDIALHVGTLLLMALAEVKSADGNYR